MSPLQFDPNRLLAHSPDDMGPGDPGRAQKTTVPPDTTRQWLSRPRELDFIAGIYIIGGIWAVIQGAGAFSVGCCVCLWPIFEMAVGVLAIIRGARIVAVDDEPPSMGLAFAMMALIIGCNIATAICGFGVWFLAKGQNVRRYFRAKRVTY